jgi:hypothetical protein
MSTDTTARPAAAIAIHSTAEPTAAAAPASHVSVFELIHDQKRRSDDPDDARAGEPAVVPGAELAAGLPGRRVPELPHRSYLQDLHSVIANSSNKSSNCSHWSSWRTFSL